VSKVQLAVEQRLSFSEFPEEAKRNMGKEQLLEVYDQFVIKGVAQS
jgi:hypothetical protein